MYREIRQIELADDNTETVIVRGGITIEFNANGGLVIRIDDDVKITVAANDDASCAACPGSMGILPSEANADSRPGDIMLDGTIYAGLSPDTGKPLYVTNTDSPLAMNWDEAKSFADQFVAHGHTDWRLPTKGELNVLFNNRAAIIGFNKDRVALRGDFPDACYYWSSSALNDHIAWAQDFNDGSEHACVENLYYAVRYVRDGDPSPR